GWRPTSGWPRRRPPDAPGARPAGVPRAGARAVESAASLAPDVVAAEGCRRAVGGSAPLWRARPSAAPPRRKSAARRRRAGEGQDVVGIAWAPVGFHVRS